MNTSDQVHSAVDSFEGCAALRWPYVTQNMQQEHQMYTHFNNINDI
jgi:hypothetical protein